MIVLARQLPLGAERLRRAGAVHLGAGDLALRPEETLELCRSGFGLEVDDAAGRLLDEATGGWTAATVLAASRARHTGEAVQTIARIAGGGDAPSSPVAAILDEALVAYGPERSLLAQIAQLPLLDRELVEVVAGREGAFEEALDLGLPFTPARDGWWELPGPVRDYLAVGATKDLAMLSRAAAYYEQRGELSTALQVLLAAGDPEAAVALLAQAEPRHIEPIDVLELRSVIDRVPVDVLDRFPLAILHIARACEAAALLEQRDAWIVRVAAAAEAFGDEAICRAVDAERASDLMRDNRSYAEAEALARGVLAESPTSETLTRARALSVVGRATCWHDGGRSGEAQLREAAGYLQQASDLYLALGLRAAAAGLAPYRAMWIEHSLGRPLAALELLSEALALVVDRPRRFAYVLLFRAEVLCELGRHAEVDADVQEVFRISRQLDKSEQSLAYGHWQLAVSHSYGGDGTATLESLRNVEALRDDWWSVAGPDFLCDAADCLDRVGYTALAWEYLERAKADQGDAAVVISLAECALLARHGDPVLAEERLNDVARYGIDVREHWRVTLLRAFARFRRGDAGAAALAAASFEQAARLGQPQLPLVREREIAEALLGLAAETGQPAALGLQASSLPLALSVLGELELTRGGRTVAIGEGQAAQLLKFVAVSGGKVRAELVIETLWPDAEPTAARNRLRTVLARLRESAPDVVTREGDLLVLVPAVRLDLTLFQSEARQALALGLTDPTPAVAMARSAISRYRGDLLPHDLYEDWADAPREAARRTMLDLLDLCAASAAERSDLDELRRVVERTIELAPYDDERYLKAASVLLEQGRKGAALTVVRRARAVLAELGLEPSLQLLRLERSLAA
jgi:DNA-binding SARP family transcriptional activator